MPITDTVDMLMASGGTAALTGVIAVVGGVLSVVLSKQVVALIQHVIDVIDDRTLARDPERARIVAELRRARRGTEVTAGSKSRPSFGQESSVGEELRSVSSFSLHSAS